MQTHPRRRRRRRHVQQMPAPIVETFQGGQAIAVRWPGIELGLLVEEGLAAWTWRGRVVRWVRRRTPALG